MSDNVRRLAMKRRTRSEMTRWLPPITPVLMRNDLHSGILNASNESTVSSTCIMMNARANTAGYHHHHQHHPPSFESGDEENGILPERRKSDTEGQAGAKRAPGPDALASTLPYMISPCVSPKPRPTAAQRKTTIIMM